MSNMSYCRFENTYGDMVECLNAIQCDERLSTSECRYAKRMFSDILVAMRDNDVIDDFDKEALNDLFDNMVGGAL